MKKEKPITTFINLNQKKKQVKGIKEIVNKLSFAKPYVEIYAKAFNYKDEKEVISYEKFFSNLDETKKELANKQHEIEIMQLEFANKINTLEYENQLKDKTIEIKNIVIESKDKDIRLLQMEMQIMKLS